MVLMIAKKMVKTMLMIKLKKMYNTDVAAINLNVEPTID